MSIAVIALLTFPPGAPLRDQETGAIVGNSPFMSSLIVQIMLVFLAIGAAYGIGAKTITSIVDGINAVTKTFANLSGLVFTAVRNQPVPSVLHLQQHGDGRRREDR